ncbi:iron ABC transporter permease [Rhizobium sp. Root1220]|uniref:ABC transporter permease n=1 Tax=Rhizobium sp. Root1220 TaxID=1736432 RepID=UPI0007013512|nr:iron ABC transporter permease [Rhizobium sp. Root1220]KQV70504.1 iron ABC transporter permease [Rhizobium sp. Root1220]
MLLPFASLVYQASKGSPGLWLHLVSTVLPVALVDTLLLLGGVGLLAGALGTMLAWLVTAFEFRGRWVLEWALLLPLAVPTYIIAYAYLDILHPIGPVQGVIRWVLGYSSPREFRLPDIRSMTGCVLLLGFVLYPYVYIPTRAIFLMQSASLIEVSRTLGVSRRGIFWRVALPLARPAVAVGVSLALMEALNDIGAAEFLGVRTLTVSIYTTWITRSDLPGSAQIALFLLLFVVALVAMERWARRRQRYSVSAQRSRVFEPRRVGGAPGVLLLLAGMLPVLFGFGAPAIFLLGEAYKRWRFAGLSERFFSEMTNTLLFAATATILTVAAGLIVAYAGRVSGSRMAPWFYRLSTMGYAAPGTVVAIGVLIVAASFDGLFDRATKQWFANSAGLLLIGSGGAVLYAYATRFLAISAGSIEAGLSRIPRAFDHAARTLGTSAGGTLFRIHLPLSKASLAAGALLVFVDCVKELPATLLLRPLNFETFATHLYGEAARGTYEEGAIAALAIVVIGILPVILLAQVGRRKAWAR